MHDFISYNIGLFYFFHKMAELHFLTN
jgi:hypothetical protein